MFALTLLLLELAGRMIGLTTPFFLRPSAATCLRRSSLLSMEFQPDCVGTLGRTTFRTNSLGLRGSQVREDGSIRILTLGDSCTWGWGVREEQSYPAVLQRLLDERRGPSRYQVINAGLPGSTSYQGVLYLRERGLSLDPALVIASYGFNDASRDGDVEDQLARERLWMPVLRLDDYLLNRSQTYRWVRWTALRGRRQDQTPRATPAKYKQNMTQLVDLARQRGARTMFVAFWHQGKLIQRDYQDQLVTVGSDLHVPIVWYEGPRIDVVHPTAEGYAILARAIFDRLEQEGFLR